MSSCLWSKTPWPSSASSWSHPRPKRAASHIPARQDSVPFQTLSTITENLEKRLEGLSDQMFKAAAETHTLLSALPFPHATSWQVPSRSPPCTTTPRREILPRNLTFHPLALFPNNPWQ